MIFALIFTITLFSIGSSASAVSYEYVEVPVVTAYSSNIAFRQSNSTTLQTSSCEFIKLCSLTSISGCDDGSKFVVKHSRDVHRQFIIFNNSPVLAFVAKKTQFANCSSFTEVTTNVNCKTVPGAENITLDSAKQINRDAMYNPLDEKLEDMLNEIMEFTELEELENNEVVEIPQVETEDTTALGRTLVGKHCEYVKLCDIVSTSGCTNSTKFLLRRENGTRRQFLILDGELVLAFVTKGIKFSDCTSKVSVTDSVVCKTHPSLEDISLPSFRMANSISGDDTIISNEDSLNNDIDESASESGSNSSAADDSTD